ncbi:MAG: LysM peptidoglycan-binding domain-containing protein [Lachnospiraceae bacterium]|nr:LysM peptidoglycan-binding domain-containing protein [Lachnospiraceae bacterium]
MKKSIGQMMRKSIASVFMSIVLAAAGIGLLPGLAMPVHATDPSESYNIQDDDVYKIYNEDCTIRIYSSSGNVTTNDIRIEVASEKTVTVILENVNINADSQAFIISGAGNVHIELRGSNTLRSGFGAGLLKDNAGKLIISGTGSLEVYGTDSGAGIGGGYHGSVSDITITGGTVTAIGGDNGGAGIGGGCEGSGSNITITGGTVTATGDEGGAGIGGGDSGSGTNIRITGGTVTATGGSEGAGIGGGDSGSGTNITISDGTVTATGGYGAAGIGGGYYGSGSNITIAGGNVVSTGKYGGAGIGGGRVTTGSNITISGDSQVSVAGSAAHTDLRYAVCGTGAGIGDGGTDDASRNPVNGTEISPDISRLLSTGRISYYPAGTSAADITSGNVQPVNTVIGTYVAPSSGQNPGPSNPQTPSSNPQTPSSNPATDQVDETSARTYIDVLEDRIRAMVPLGGPQTIYWDEGTALSYSIMKLLEENPQITLVFSYSYDGTDYKVTIPGKNVKTDPSIPWYGPLYLWANYRMYSGNGSEAEVPSQVAPDTTTATYTVVAGDTLSAIALRLNTTVEYLAYVNGIKNPDMIQIGQVIKY